MTTLTDIDKYNEAIQRRDWTTCDLIADELKGLQDELKKSYEKIEIAVDHLKEIEKHLLDNDPSRAKNLIKYVLDRIERVQK